MVSCHTNPRPQTLHSTVSRYQQENSVDSTGVRIMYYSCHPWQQSTRRLGASQCLQVAAVCAHMQNKVKQAQCSGLRTDFSWHMSLRADFSWAYGTCLPDLIIFISFLQRGKPVPHQYFLFQPADSCTDKVATAISGTGIFPLLQFLVQIP